MELLPQMYLLNIKIKVTKTNISEKYIYSVVLSFKINIHFISKLFGNSENKHFFSV